MPPTVSMRRHSCVSTARRARCSSALAGRRGGERGQFLVDRASISSSLWPGRATTSMANTEPSAWPYCDAVTDCAIWRS